MTTSSVCVDSKACDWASVGWPGANVKIALSHAKLIVEQSIGVRSSRLVCFRPLGPTVRGAKVQLIHCTRGMACRKNV